MRSVITFMLQFKNGKKASSQYCIVRLPSAACSSDTSVANSKYFMCYPSVVQT